MMLPRARQDGLLVQEIGDELVIYDQERHHAHSLNKVAALIWQHCDGQTTIEDMVVLLHSALQRSVDEDLIWLTLERFEKAYLLKESIVRPTKVPAISRREIIRKIASAGLATLVISLAIPPLVAHATLASCPNGVGACIDRGGCQPQYSCHQNGEEAYVCYCA